MVRYISPQPGIMENVLDSEAFFRTGDLGRMEDDIVYLLGRASQDGNKYSFTLEPPISAILSVYKLTG